MKFVLVLLLIGIAVVSCIPKGPRRGGRGGGRRGGRGGDREGGRGPARRPCGGSDNIEECTCEDGEIYDDEEDLKESCRRRGPDANPIEYCTCVDGTTWEPPGDREGGRSPGRPCGGRDNIEECTCEDGEIYDDKEYLKENCRRHGPDANPIKSCSCGDGKTWEPPEHRGGGRGPERRRNMGTQTG